MCGDHRFWRSATLHSTKAISSTQQAIIKILSHYTFSAPSFVRRIALIYSFLDFKALMTRFARTGFTESHPSHFTESHPRHFGSKLFVPDGREYHMSSILNRTDTCTIWTDLDTSYTFPSGSKCIFHRARFEPSYTKTLTGVRCVPRS